MVKNPGFLKHGIILFWLAGILLQSVCLWILCKRRLASKHLGVALWLAISLGVQSYQIWCGLNSRTGWYVAYKETLWIQEFATFVLVFGVFWTCVSHYPKPLVLGVGIVAIAGGGAAITAVSLAGSAVAGAWDRSIGLLIARLGNEMLGALVFLLASRAIFVLIDPLSINAKRAYWATTAFAGGTWMIYGVALCGAPVRLIQYATITLAMACSIQWMRMRSEGEFRPSGSTRPPSPDVLRERKRKAIDIIEQGWKNYWD